MPSYRVTALVLRTHKLGEADRIVSLLTKERGIVRAVAKGVRKTSSRFGARLEPFMHSDVQLAEARSLHIVQQVETLSPLARGIAADYGRYTAGTAMLETAERLVADTAEPSVQQFNLLLGALTALSNGRLPSDLILDSFQLRSLAIAGYAATFDACATCGVAGPHRRFNASSGGMLCETCAMPGCSVPAADTVSLLAALQTGRWEEALVANDRARREAGSLVANYLSWHLERALRSLPHVDRTVMV